MINITWEQYLKDVYDLGVELKEVLELNDFTFISGIPRGGLIPATILAHQLGISYVSFDSILTYDKRCRTLIIEDIVDSGSTVKEFQEIHSGRDDVFASIYLRSTAETKPDFYWKEIPNDDWIVFPYENAPEDEAEEKKRHAKERE